MSKGKVRHVRQPFIRPRLSWHFSGLGQLSILATQPRQRHCVSLAQVRRLREHGRAGTHSDRVPHPYTGDFRFGSPV